MAAKLQARHAAARQARRILRAQARNALKRLRGGRASDEDIHAARRNIKKARATLRLLRQLLSRRAYRRENRALRAAAQPLSMARDAKVLVGACDSVRQRYTTRQIHGVGKLRSRLVRARNGARRRVLARAGGVQQSRKLLRRARRAAADWPLGKGGWSKLVNGAAQVYESGRAALDQVRREPTVAHLHQWRKQAKYLYYQLELLRPICPADVGRLSDQLHTLSDDLGDDHDLAVLRANIATHVDFPRQAGATAFMTQIERARTALQKQALLRGAQLYRPTPAGFVRRLNGARAGRPRSGRRH
jgi:CHAD domain-containing protein